MANQHAKEALRIAAQVLDLHGIKTVMSGERMFTRRPRAWAGPFSFQARIHALLECLNRLIPSTKPKLASTWDGEQTVEILVVAR